MIYKTIAEITVTELNENMSACERIIPVHKSLKDDLTLEINWINNHKHLIPGAACEFIWDLYYEDFIDQKILRRYDFYKLIRRQLDLECNTVRTANESIKYCFVEKST